MLNFAVATVVGAGGKLGPSCEALQPTNTIPASAINAGATQQKPLENQFYGDRSGTLADPFGHQWTLATHVEDVPPEEMQRRMEQFSQGQKQPETV